MTLIIEDGTAKVDANSYVSVATFRTYAEARGVTLSDDDAECEILLIKAMDWLYSKRSIWKGERTTTTQALDWPRANATDVVFRGDVYPSTSIPSNLTYAQMAAACEAASNDLQPNQLPSNTGAVISKKVGPIEIAYANQTEWHGRVPIFSKAEAFMNDLIRRNGLVAVRT
jgi:hypothetical protein